MSKTFWKVLAALGVVKLPALERFHCVVNLKEGEGIRIGEDTYIIAKKKAYLFMTGSCAVGATRLKREEVAALGYARDETPVPSIGDAV